MPRELALKLLVEDEGLKLLPYDDATGKPVEAPIGKITIGYGCNLSAGIDQAEAEFLLKHRENIAEQAAEAVIGDAWQTLSEARQAVFVCMAYQIGRHGLRSFKKTVQAAIECDYVKAAAEMMDSGWGRSFRNRAERLAKIMRTGSI